MKNRFFLGLLIGLLVFCTSTSSFAEADSFDVGEIYIVQIKQGLGVVFSVPDQYLTTDGSLSLPLFLTIEKDGQLLYSETHNEPAVILSNINLTKGTYQIFIKIGNLQEVKKIFI